MKTSTHMLKTGLFASTALVLLSGTAHAADAPAAPPAAAGEIIVTAQRRDQSLQDVPMTLQALSADSLSKLNVTTFNDLLKYTPNVTFGANGPGQGAIFMRGLSAGFAGSQSAGTIGAFPNVALYLDDQSMSFPSHNADIYVADIERVEVLEGPQGALFGGGAEAGVVRYITAKPKLNKFEGKFEGSFSGTAGGGVNGAFNAMINVPVVEDKLAVRAVIYDDHHGGYIDNVYSTFTRRSTDLGNYWTNGSVPPKSQQSELGAYNNAAQVQKDFNPADYVGGRFALTWKVAPDWDILVSEAYQSLDTKGTFSTQSYSYDYAPLTGLSSTLFVPQYSKDNYWNTAWSLNGKAGDFKVVYTGAYMVRHLSQQGDYTNYARAIYGAFYQCTGGNGGYNYWNHGAAPYCYAPTSYWTDNIRTTHQSHEFRVTTPEGKSVRAILGAYYESYKIQDNQDWDYKTIPACDLSLTAAQIKTAGTVCIGAISPNPAATLNVAGARGPGVAFGEDTQRGYKQYAAFGSVDFDIQPNLTVSAGTRYYNYKTYETGVVYSGFNSACYQVPVCVVGTNLDALGLKASYKGFKSRAVLTFKPQDHTMLYAMFSQGFRPPAFNRGSTSRLSDPTSGVKMLSISAYNQPDSLNNWETGLKTDLFDRKVQFNLSSYYMVWKNSQLGYFNPAAGFGNTAFGYVGPTYHIKGVEAQITAAPTTGLFLQGSATYNDTRQANAACFLGNVPGTTYYNACIKTAKTGGRIVNVPAIGAIGDTAPFSPKFQASFRARYEWEAKNDIKWFVSSGISYTGSMTNQPSSSADGTKVDNASTYLGPNGIIVPGTTLLRYTMPGYALVDASVGFSHDNWTVTIFGENLTNSHASTFTTSAEFIKTEAPVRPLIYGIKITTKM